MALGALAGATALALRQGDALALGRTPLGGKLTLRVPWSSAPDRSLRPARSRGRALRPRHLRLALRRRRRQQPVPGASHRDAGARGRGHRCAAARGSPHRSRDCARRPRRDCFDRFGGGRGGWRCGPICRDRRRTRPIGSRFVFGSADPTKLARALASPLYALVPRGFGSSSPDGTGAFRATSRVASSPSHATPTPPAGGISQSIAVYSAPDSKTSLRQFEAERDDVGWLGMGLFGGRKNAARFDCGGARLHRPRHRLRRRHGGRGRCGATPRERAPGRAARSSRPRHAAAGERRSGLDRPQDRPGRRRERAPPGRDCQHGGADRSSPGHEVTVVHPGDNSRLRCGPLARVSSLVRATAEDEPPPPGPRFLHRSQTNFFQYTGQEPGGATHRRAGPQQE